MNTSAYNKLSARIGILCVLSMMAQMISGQSREVVENVILNPADIFVEEVADGDQSSFSRLSWTGLSPEATSGAYDTPLLYLHLPVSKYGAGFNVSVEDIVYADPIGVQLPIGKVTPLTSIAEEAGRGDLSDGAASPSISLNDKSSVWATLDRDYYLFGKEHYAVVKINPFKVRTAYEIYPVSSFTIRLAYEDTDMEAVSSTIETGLLGSDVMKAVSKVAEASAQKDYFIITTSKLKEKCQELYTWKSQKGLNTALYCIEDILADSKFSVNGTGIRDEAEALRTFLQSLYDADREQYCILIGPSSEIPYRYMYSSSSREGDNGDILLDNFIPSDTYYSDLVSKWNFTRESDGRYTMAVSNLKYNPSINVGRLICSTPGELDNYFHKLYLYEGFPGRGQTSYLDKGVVTKQWQHLEYSDLIKELGTHEIVVEMKDNQQYSPSFSIKST